MGNFVKTIDFKRPFCITVQGSDFVLGVTVMYSVTVTSVTVCQCLLGSGVKNAEHSTATFSIQTIGPT